MINGEMKEWTVQHYFYRHRLFLLVIILVVDHSVSVVEMLWGWVVSFFIMKFILSLFKFFLLSDPDCISMYIHLYQNMHVYT